MEALVKANRRAIYREFFVNKFLANRRKLEWRMDKVKIQLITMQYQCAQRYLGLGQRHVIRVRDTGAE